MRQALCSATFTKFSPRGRNENQERYWIATVFHCTEQDLANAVGRNENQERYWIATVTVDVPINALRALVEMKTRRDTGLRPIDHAPFTVATVAGRNENQERYWIATYIFMRLQIIRDPPSRNENQERYWIATLPK